MHIIKASIFCFVLIGSSSFIKADQMGSDSIVAKQGKALFRTVSNSNVLSGFSVFEQGMMCESVSTEAFFNAFFPISGNLTFNGGKLSLQRDLVLKSPLYWGTGVLYGNSQSIEWPRNILDADFPAPFTNKHALFMDEESTGFVSGGSVSWSYDGQYVAISGNTGSDSTVSVYLWNGSGVDFIVTATIVGETTHTVMWDSNSYYLITAGASVHSWLFDVGLSTLTIVDTVASPANPTAAAWSPDASAVAVVYGAVPSTVVYPIAAGVFGAGLTSALPVTGSVTMASLAWHTNSSRYVIGLGGTVNKHIVIVGYDGIATSIESTYVVGQSVYSIAWKPQSMIITAGLGSGINCLRLYEYNSGTFTLSPLANDASDNEVGIITDLAYNSTGTLLFVTKMRDSRTYSLSLFHYDDWLEQLYLTTGDGFDTQSYEHVRWAPDGEHAATVDALQNVAFYEFITAPQILSDVKLFFGSDLAVHGEILIFGDCVISGGGYDLDLSDVVSIIIEPNSSLLLDNVTLRGLDATRIMGVNGTSNLTLRNVFWHQDGDTAFANGSLVIQDFVSITGSNIFAYTSDQPITIRSRATLVLDATVTFSFDPITADASLLQLEDSLASLHLNGAVVRIGSGGLQLLNGKIVVASNTDISSTVIDLGGGSFLDNGITFGDGILAHDSTLEVRDSMQLFLTEGSLNYKNSGTNGWGMVSDLSSIKLGTGTALNVYNTMQLQKGMVIFGDMSTFGIVDLMQFSASTQQLGTVLYVNVLP